MKKLSLIIVAVAFLSLVACKKDYVCTCTEDGTATKTTLVDVTKRQAKANCVSTSMDLGGVTAKSECVLSK